MASYAFKDKDGRNVEILGKSTVTPEEFSQDLLAYMVELRDTDTRIHCDCVANGAVSRAKLLTDSGTYYLARIGKTEHTEDCQLYLCGKETISIPVMPKKTPSLIPYAVGTTVSDKEVDSDKGKNSNRTKVRRSSPKNRMYTNLAHLLNGYSGTGKDKRRVTRNTWCSDKTWKWNEVFFSKIASNPFINGKPLKRILDVPDSKNNYISESDSFLAYFEKNICKETVPQFFKIRIVDSFSFEDNGHTIVFTNEDDKKESIFAKKRANRFDRTGGPRIIFSHHVYADGQWFICDMYTHPVVSREIPILVDSEYERAFFNKLKNKVESFGKHREELRFRIIKPYFANVFDDNPHVPLIPDFKLSIDKVCKETKHAMASKQILVEVMGMNDEEYAERKRRIVPMMKGRFNLEVVETMPTSFDDDIKILFHKDTLKGKWKKFSQKN